MRRNALCNKLSVRVDLLDFGHVDDDLLPVRKFCKILFDNFNLGTRFSDENAGTSRVDRYNDFARRTLDQNFGDRRRVVFSF